MRHARVLAVFAAAAVAAGICYAPALGGAFISDDGPLVADNPAVHSIPAALRSFDASYWSGVKPVAPYYRPLPLVSYSLDYAAGGRHPFAFHVTNAALHVLNCWLVAMLVLALSAHRADSFGKPPGAARLAGVAFAALLAAVHPLHGEPVAAIYGRPELLAACGGLAFLNFAVRGRTLLAVVALAVALFSKESALGLPLMMPFALAAGGRILDSSPGLRGRDSHHLMPSGVVGTVAAAGLLAIYVVLRYRALGAFTDPGAISRLDNPLAGFSLEPRIVGAVSVVASYAKLWFWPARLCADRGFDAAPLAASWTDPRFLAGAAILVAGLIVLLVLARKRSLWGIPLAAAGLTYLPASNLIIQAPAAMAERFAYFPSLCLCVIAGGLLAGIDPGGAKRGKEAPGWPYGRQALRWMALGLVVAAGARTYVRAADFRSDLTWYGSGAASCPRSAKTHYNLGNALGQRGEHEEAADAYLKAVEIAPWLAVAHNNLGATLLRMRRLDEAERSFRQAIKESPNLVTPHASLAGILYMKGKLAEALKETRAAMALHPGEGDRIQLEQLERKIEERMEIGG